MAQMRNVKRFYNNSLRVRKCKPSMMKNIHTIYLPQGTIHLNFARRQTLSNISSFMPTATTFEFSSCPWKGTWSSSLPEACDLSSYDSEGADFLFQMSLVDSSVLSSSFQDFEAQKDFPADGCAQVLRHSTCSNCAKNQRFIDYKNW